MKQTSHTATLCSPHLCKRGETYYPKVLFIEFNDGGPLVRIDHTMHHLEFKLEEDILRLNHLETKAALVASPLPELADMETVSGIKVETVAPESPAVDLPPLFIVTEAEHKSWPYLLHQPSETVYKYVPEPYDEDPFFVTATPDYINRRNEQLLQNTATGTVGAARREAIAVARAGGVLQSLLPVPFPDNPYTEEIPQGRSW